MRHKIKNPLKVLRRGAYLARKNISFALDNVMSDANILPYHTTGTRHASHRHPTEAELTEVKDKPRDVTHKKP
jgi:hypothetical protein